MSHPLYDVITFAIIGPYTLHVGFNDGFEQIVDMSPILYGELFAPLRDPTIFAQVRLDPELQTLVWPNGADIDPYVLHEWPRLVGGLARRLQTLAPVAA